MISPHRIPFIVFSEEKRNFFSPKKLWIVYQWTSKYGKALARVYTFIEYILCMQIHFRNDHKIKNNEVISWNS